MRRAPTLGDVARRSGYSTSTVSRVLNDDERASPVARAAVPAAIAELAYVPSAAARGLASQRTGMVGVVLGPAAVGALPDLELAAWEAGLAVTVAVARGPGREERVRSMVGRVDGIVVVGDALPRRVLRQVAARVPVAPLAPGPDGRLPAARVRRAMALAAGTGTS